MAIGLMFAAPIGGALIGKVQPRYVIFASTLVAGFGMYLFSFIDVRSTALDIMIPLFIMAFGLGFGMAQRTSAVASAVPQNEIGVASSVLALARNIAGAFGIALFGTLLNNVTNSNVLNIARNSALYIHTQAATTEFITLIELKAQIDAYGVVYLTAAGLLMVGAFAALLLKVKEVKLDEPLIIEA